MKKVFAAAAILFAFTLAAGASERRDNDVDRIQTASVVLKQIMSAPDNAIPDSIMSGAKCIAIIPSSLKGGFIFGANYGKGVATCRTEKGWSAPTFFKLTGGSFGFQAGGQASDLVLIVRTDDGMQYLLHSKFKLGADASAAAGPVGRDAQAMTDLTLRAQVLTYSRSRGLFLGVSLSGGVIKQDDADTQAFYGKDWTYRALLNGQVPAPSDAQVFLNMVERYAPTPRPRVASPVSPVPASAETTPTASVAPAAATPAAAASTASTSKTPLSSDSPAAETSSSASQPPAAEPVATVTQPEATVPDAAIPQNAASTQLR